jgi:hypothetical protein
VNSSRSSGVSGAAIATSAPHGRGAEQHRPRQPALDTVARQSGIKVTIEGKTIRVTK